MVVGDIPNNVRGERKSNKEGRLWFLGVDAEEYTGELPQARSLLCGSELYCDTLKDCHMETITVRNQRADAAEECLWMNFEPPTQIQIFDELLEGGVDHA